MQSTDSISKGCFAFKPPQGSKKARVADPLSDFSQEPWYKSYRQVWEKVEEELDGLRDDVSEKLLEDLIQFIKTAPENKQNIPTAVLLTGINLPDHEYLFGRMSTKLRESVTQHIAVLRASDCTTLKGAIEKMIGQLMKTVEDNELLEVDSEDEEESGQQSKLKRRDCTMPALLKWFENKNIPSPTKRSKLDSRTKLVVVIPEFEAFPVKLLHNFILILSCYADRLPLVLVLGVATTMSAVNNALPHKVTSHLTIRLFQSQPSVYFLNNTLDKVFLNSQRPFLLGPKVFKFLTDVFLFYDFSVHRFTQGIKFSLMQHFYERPESVLCCPEEELVERVTKLNKRQLQAIVELPSIKKYLEENDAKDKADPNNSDELKELVLELKVKLNKKIFKFYVGLKILHILVSQLPQAPLGKQIRELYCGAVTSPISNSPKFKECNQLLSFQSKDEISSKLTQVAEYLAGLPFYKEWAKKASRKFSDLKANLEASCIPKETKSPTKSPRKIDLTSKNRSQLKEKLSQIIRVEETGYEKCRKEVLSYVMGEFLPKHLTPLVAHPLHEVVVCDNASAIKRQIVGAPRAALHTALNNPQFYLECDCCRVEHSGEIRREMPDICIAYKLHLESGALINMYDWLVAFMTIVDPEGAVDNKEIKPEIQARFTQAISELEFLGFIKSSKRKVDHVARLTWGGTL